MRKYNFLQFSLIAFCAFLYSCSPIIGIYCTDTDYTGYCYELLEKNKFRKSYSSCTFCDYAYGSYQIAGDSITFIYDNSIEPQKGAIAVNKIAKIPDSIIINLTVTSESTKNPIGFYTAAIWEKGGLTGGIGGGQDGKTTIELPYTGEPYEIEISFLSHAPYKFKARDTGKYIIDIELSGNECKKSTRVDIEKFKIIELSKEYFTYSATHELHTTVSKLSKVKK